MILKLGIIGTGKIGQQHIRRCKNVLKNVKVVAVSDINIEVAKKTLDDLNIKANVYQDGYEIINSPKVDAILITSWDSTHEEFTLAAIKAKKPVFCEKPLALDADGCRRIIDAEIKYGKRLVQVGFMRSYDSSYRALKDSIVNGEIGRPLILHCAHRNQYVDDNYTTDMIITNTLIHELDILRWLTEDNYKSVQIIFPRSTSKSHPKLKDPQIILLETQKGIRINVEIFVNCTYAYDIQCEIIGEDGTVKLSDPSSIQIRKNTCLYNKLFATWQERFIDAYNTELQTFINDIENNVLTGPSAWDGFVASIAADVCLKAQKSGNIEPIVVPLCPLFYSS